MASLAQALRRHRRYAGVPNRDFRHGNMASLGKLSDRPRWQTARIIRWHTPVACSTSSVFSRADHSPVLGDPANPPDEFPIRDGAASLESVRTESREGVDGGRGMKQDKTARPSHLNHELRNISTSVRCGPPPLLGRWFLPGISKIEQSELA